MEQFPFIHAFSFSFLVNEHFKFHKVSKVYFVIHVSYSTEPSFRDLLAGNHSTMHYGDVHKHIPAKERSKCWGGGVTSFMQPTTFMCIPLTYIHNSGKKPIAFPFPVCTPSSEAT